MPQDGLDIQGNKDCKYHKKNQLGQNGKKYCYCDTPKISRRAADYNDP